MSLPLIIKDIEDRLKLSGGKIDGNLFLNGSVSKYSSGDQNYIHFLKGSVSQGYLGVNGENNPVFISADATTVYDLYGEHNKPNAVDIGAMPDIYMNWRGYSDIESAIKAELTNVVQTNKALVFATATSGGNPFLIVATNDGGVISGLYTNYNGIYKGFRKDSANNWYFYNFYGEHNKPTPANIGAAPNSHYHAAGDISIGSLPIARGGTGATTEKDARENLGLNTVKIDYRIDLSSYSTSNFYFIDFGASDLELDCEIHSPNLSGSEPYNQNEIHFLMTYAGWSDTPKSFQILHQGSFTSTELTIMSIVAGTQSGLRGVYVRGGMVYRFRSNFAPTLNTSTRTYGNESYASGTTSITTITNATTVWTNDGTNKSYMDRLVVGTNTDYTTRRVRNTGANTSLGPLGNGEVYLVYS